MTATLRAMESAGVVRTLAEPNLTAISGESATFIAGGEFPIPAGYSCDPTTHVCTTQISFKKFGISLNFTPGRADRGPHQPARDDRSFRTVERQFDHAVASRQRHVDQLADHSLDQDPPCGNHAGNSLGRLDGDGRPDPEQTKQADQRLPGLMQLPVLGALFRSRDYVNSQTELMVW